MGQYGNQPDFATRVITVTSLPISNINGGSGSAVYIGAVTNPALTTTSITVTPIDGSTDVTFSGLNAGTFLPIIISKITSVVNIPLTSILLYN